MTKNKNYLKSNIDYLLKSRKETQISLSEGAGVNRTTIYNILEGKVDRVQSSTVRKVAGFFGVSFSEIQTLDLREKELSNDLIALDGNMNPIAVPIVTDTTLMSALKAKIGNLVVSSEITYFFGEGPNVIGIHLSKEIRGYYNKGDVLIVRRWVNEGEGNILVITPKMTLRVVRNGRFSSASDELVGTIVEERYGVQ